jgi:hypothetical protein
LSFHLTDALTQSLDLIREGVLEPSSFDPFVFDPFFSGSLSALLFRLFLQHIHPTMKTDITQVSINENMRMKTVRVAGELDELQPVGKASGSRGELAFMAAAAVGVVPSLH